MKTALNYIFTALLSLFVLGACSSDNSRYIVDSPQTISLQVTPSNVKVPKQTQGDYTAIAYYSDGSYKDVSLEVIWSSSDESVVAFNSTTSNHAEALSVGISYISASIDGVQSNMAKVEVTNVTLDHLDIDPIVESVPNGVNVKYRAIGYFSDGSFYNLTLFSTFSSSNTSVATIQSKTPFKSGLATTLSVGSTNITASFRGVTSNPATLNVTAATLSSIQVTPADVLVPVGTQDRFTAIGFYSDNTSHEITTEVVWNSDNSNVVTVISGDDLAGEGEALKEGIANITATLGGVTSNEAKVTVEGKIIDNVQIVPNSVYTPLGTQVQYSVHAIYTDYTSKDVTAYTQIMSENFDIVTFDSDNLATTVGVGYTFFTAVYEGVRSEREQIHVTAPTLTSIQVTPADVDVPVGTQGRFIATAFYSDNSSADVSTQVTWASDDDNVVHIISSGEDGGLATALSAGTANITAFLEGVTSNIAKVNVAVKTISNVQITPNNQSYDVGATHPYKVSVVYTDLSVKDVTEFSQIRSFDTSIATFDTDNIMTAVGVGDVEISAVYEGVTSEREFLHVRPITLTSIQVTPADISVAKGSLESYTAVAYFSDNTHRDISDQATWISANTDIAKVVPSGAKGGLTAASDVGITNISASFNGVISNLARIEVTAATLESIEIVAHDISFPKGARVYYQAVAHYSDFTSTDITNEAIWSSSDTGVATVDRGVVDGIEVGTANISIAFEDKTDLQAITVTNPTVSSVLISPATHSMDIGVTQRYIATATFSDASTKDVTRDVLWISSDLDVARIRNSTFLQGRAKALSEGTTNINASYQGSIVGNTAVLTVKAPAVTLDTIVVTPANQTVTEGSYVGYTATGNYSDASSKDITQDVSWQSSSTAVATIETVGELKGVAQAISSGSTTIFASLDGISGSTSLNVSGDCGNNPPITITIIPDPANIPVGTVKQLHLIGTWPEACEREISFDPAAVWSSSDDDIVEMASKGGEALGKTSGSSATITAKYRSKTDTSTVNVTP